MTMGWQIYVFAIVLATFIGHFVFLGWTTKYKKEDNVGEDTTTGHTWDGDLSEWNKPLPRWWLFLFHGTVVFGMGYLVLYPGSGVYDGALGWSQTSQYAAGVEEAERKYGQIFANFAAQEIPALAGDADAMSAGFNLFGNNCAQCHGSDARGAVGFPNLADGAWLWGGSPDQIEATILNGRVGVMPPWGAAIGGDAEVEKVAQYVLSLSGLEHDAAKAAEGQQKYMMFCVACHGPTGAGNQALGAPNLSDGHWVYEPTLASISETIANGRNNEMPAFVDTLGADRVKVLAAYVYSLNPKDGE